MLQPAAVRRLMLAAPVPVAIRLPDGLVLRGHEWPVDGPVVVFLHDHGDDLDAWGPITAGVASHGFRVISVELRGHGLSDGDADPSLVGQDLPALLRETAASFGPVALVAYGRVTEAMLFVNEDHGAPVQVMISPLPDAPGEIDWRTTRSAMRLVVKGALNEEVEGQVGFIYPRMRGPKLQVSGASDAAGPSLLEDQPQLLEHMVTFLRRYLTGHHLAWIADHTDQITEAREERLAAEAGTDA
ncbi:MAG: hypothetical protein F4X74_03080 [Acidimicrobiia bacterium]|nr:hypothetical protein [Acidimicrobiia bacterium]